jgi:hypothetical protein
MEKQRSCFDELSMNGRLLMLSISFPFALSRSKGEQRAFRSLSRLMLLNDDAQDITDRQDTK